MVIDIVLGFAEGRGGLEKVLTMVTQELTKRGHRVRVFQMYPPNNPEWEETIPEIYYYDMEGNSYTGELEIFRLSLGYKQYIDILGVPDIILATHTPLFCLVSRLAVSKLGDKRPPILSWLHGPPDYFGGGEYLRYCDGHLAISQGILCQIKKYVSDATIIGINNPVDIDHVKEVKRPEEGLSLLFIGRLANHEKRLDIMFNALKKLEGKWKLTLIGEGDSHPVVKSLAKEIEIDQNITWLGWQDRPWDKVKEASLLLLTSDFEGFGLVVVEALARGIPVISSRTEGPSEIIQNGVNGWLFPVGDTDQLKKILQEIIDGKKRLPEKEVCMKSVSRFRVKNVIDNLEKTLMYSINGKKALY